MSDKIFIFDTTLRDGEQTPGANLNVDEKLQIARHLELLNVDVIEAGFPFSSPGDFAAVQAVAREIRGPQIAGLARAFEKDIDACWEAVKEATNPRIHTFISTSDIHLKHQMRKNRDEVLEMAVAAVKHASRYTSNVEFSAMDASRSDLAYVAQMFTAVIDAGATTVNFPDTVGYAIPEEFGEMIKYLMEHIPNIHKAVISVHCHNDLGLAVANTLEAIRQRRPPGGSDHQRPGRTGRQRLPGGGGHGPGHPQGPVRLLYRDRHPVHRPRQPPHQQADRGVGAAQ